MTPRQMERVQQLNQLRTTGAISEDEFEEQKAKALAGRPGWVVPAAVGGAALLLGVSAYTGLGTTQHGLFGSDNASEIEEAASTTANASSDAVISATSKTDVGDTSVADMHEASSTTIQSRENADQGTASTSGDPCVGFWRTTNVEGGVATLAVQDYNKRYGVTYDPGTPLKQNSGMVFDKPLEASVGIDLDDPDGGLADGRLSVRWGNLEGLDIKCDARSAGDDNRPHEWRRITQGEWAQISR